MIGMVAMMAMIGVMAMMAMMAIKLPIAFQRGPQPSLPPRQGGVFHKISESIFVPLNTRGRRKLPQALEVRRPPWAGVCG